MVTKPLFLTILVVSVDEIASLQWKGFSSEQERLHYLFEAYIRRMFKRSYRGKNVGIIFLISSPLVGLGAVVVLWLMKQYGDATLVENFAWYEVLIVVIMIALWLGVFRSGIPVMQHISLRLVLWRKGYAPWNYALFLDYATNRLFLQRVGGGYRFIHDLLREHFKTADER